jgi:16S rRNA G1207 methylase RsmC
MNDMEDFQAMAEDGAEEIDLAEFNAITYIVGSDENFKIVKNDLHDCRKALKSEGKLYICHNKDFNAEKILRKVFGNSKAKRRSVDYQVSVSRK